MSYVYMTPRLDNKLFIKRIGPSLLIKNNLFSKKLTSSKLSLSENNIRNPLYHKSRQNYNNYLNNLKPYNFIKNDNNLSKYYRENKNYSYITYNNKYENSFSSNFNKFGTDSFFSSKENNCNEESNNNNYKTNNSKIIDNNEANNLNKKDNNDDIKILKLKALNPSQKKIIKKIIHENKIKKIIDSLLNSSKKDNYNRFISETKSEEKIRFPKEKMIDPIRYIRCNMQKDQMDKSLYRQIESLMKDGGKKSISKEYEINLLKKANYINNNHIDINHLNIPDNENNLYKKKYEDMIKQTKYYESFHFNKKDYLHRKLKKYLPYQNILDRTYKTYLYKDREFGYKRQNFNDIIKKKNKSKIKLEKNINEYIPFDTRLNNIIKSSKETEKNATQKSKEHEKMIKKINKIICSY